MSARLRVGLLLAALLGTGSGRSDGQILTERIEVQGEVPATLARQPRPVALPFTVGEKLVYRASIPRFRGGGTGQLRVKGRETVRDRETWVLDFAFSGRVAFASVSDSTTSWFDPERLAARRFQKRERSPLASIALDVELFPEQGRWEAGSGERGVSLSSTPLDELSFLYFVRTLPLEEGSNVQVHHHFDQARNPVGIHVLGRSTATVPAGTFDVVIVEMRVQDPGRFGGAGRVRMHLTDDARRLPVRLETSVPVAGKVILVLESWESGRGSRSETQREPFHSRGPSEWRHPGMASGNIPPSLSRPSPQR